MNKTYKPNKEDWEALLQRPTQTLEDIELTVNDIFSEVRSKGDNAVSKYTDLFDGIKLDSFKVTAEE
ncbi:MAG TPA: histidinol dehydrogenase, partial [Gillisia sp.]|nr:histidinol dehydrogenase [Gillisia sp.]